MLETGSPSKTFLGVCFILFGFDPADETKIRLKLLDGGGVDAGQYNQNCTHVIVDKIVSDDPVCVEARNDGKTLVTGLWVDHSVDVGTPVDPTSIIYCPLRDLNGIPGAKNLIMCLTGYQRQDRDDIMTMVGLMGAKFSKPLVANKVTHLICYKFEGEKYELAVKMKRIKLVNHRWLEDCLRDWKLLPEDNYKKSGYELEMMGAEAQDSEDAAAETNRKQSSETIQNLKDGTPETCELPKSTEEGLLGFVKPQNMLLSPGSLNRGDLASGISRLFASEVSSCQDVNNFKDAASVELPDPQERTPKSIKVANDFKSISKSVERSPQSDRELCDLSYTRKTPTRSPKSIFTGQSCGVKGSPKLHLGGSINVPSVKENEHASELFASPCNEAFQKAEGRELLFAEASIDKKQKTDSGSVSKNICHNAEAWQMQSAKASGVEEKSLVNDLSKSVKLSPFSINSDSSGDMDENRKIANGNTKRQDGLFNESKASESVGKPVSDDSKTEKAHEIVEAGELQNSHQDEEITSLGSRKSGEKESNTHANLYKEEAENAKSITRPLRKKTVAKKTLGSRPKLKSTVNQKGSIYLSKTSAQDNPAISLTVDKKGSGNDKLSNSSEREMCPAAMNAAGEEKTKFASGVDTVSVTKTSFMDYETEAPEEKEECGNVLDKGNVVANLSIGNINGDTIETHKSDESTSQGNGRKRKLSKGKRLSSGKEETKSDLPDSKLAEHKTVLDAIESFDPGDSDEKAVVKKRQGRCPSSPTKNRNTAQKKGKGSVQLEKENNPLVDEDQNASLAKEFLSMKGSKSNKTKVKINQKDMKKDQNCSPMIDVSNQVESQPACFILSGHKLQRKEFQQVIRRLKGKFCRDSHQWSYQATHFITPDPIRRTEKFFAAAASGRWILQTDYLTACSQAGKFLAEESYEWHKSGLSEDGAINLEAPRKWRLLRARTGHGALYGMRILTYGECIAPPLDTLKRVVKAGDGTILATSPPYTRFLTSGVDYAVISPGMPRVDVWVQEFLKHEIPCIVADYMVDYVCKPGYPLERHVLYNTQAWAEKSFANLVSRAEEIVTDSTP